MRNRWNKLIELSKKQILVFVYTFYVSCIQFTAFDHEALRFKGYFSLIHFCETSISLSIFVETLVLLNCFPVSEHAELCAFK